MSLLYHGDCLVALPKLAPESVQLALTDPPYMVGYRDRSGRSIANDMNSDWLASGFAEMFRVLRRDSVCAASTAGTRSISFSMPGKKPVS